MADGFIPVDRDQQWLMPPSVAEWVPQDHPVRFVVDAVEVLDLSAFVARHPLGGPGRRAYHPAMMVALLLWAYTNKVYSSREIERRCVADVTFRFVCANQVPDHGTIARFRADCQQELKDLHAQVLAMCHRLGLVQVGVVALDGTKLMANASKDANHTQAWLESEIDGWFEQAAAADAADQERFGGARGDEVPEELVDRQERLRRLREARDKVVERKGMRRRPEQRHREPKANVTDPESGLMPVRGGGYVQGYNAQAVACPGGVVLATGVTGTPVDAGQFVPMLAEMTQNLADAGVDDPVGVVLADAGYWSHANSEADVAADDVLIATDQRMATTEQAVREGLAEPVEEPDRRGEERLAVMQAWERGEIDHRQVKQQLGLARARVYELRDLYRRHGPDALVPHGRPAGSGRKPKPPSAAQRAKQAMRVKLTSAEGKQLYAQRAPTIEGVFGNSKHNRGFRRFSRRGLTAVDTEWALLHLAGNLDKARRALHMLTMLMAGNLSAPTPT